MLKVNKTLLTLSSFAILAGVTPMINAQAAVNLEPEVYVQKEGQAPEVQGNVEFQILNADTQEVVWSQTKDNKSEGQLSLPAGNYIYRLYNIADLVGSDKDVTAEKVQQTMDPEGQASGNYTDASQKGALNTLDDGSVVYDLPFTLEVAQDAEDTSAKLVSELDVYFNQVASGEAESAASSESETGDAGAGTANEAENPAANSEAAVSESIEAAPTESQTDGETSSSEGQVNPGVAADPAQASSEVASEAAPEQVAAAETGKLTFQILDDKDQPVANTVVTLGEQAVTTDASGLAVFEVPAGTYNYNVTEIPEGYTLDVTEPSIAVEAGQDMTFPLNLTATAEDDQSQAPGDDATAQEGKWTFQILDEKDKPVKGVTVTVGDQSLTTDDQGLAAFTLPVGDYKYSISNLPKGYTIKEAESSFAIDPGQDMTFPLNLTPVESGDGSSDQPTQTGKWTFQILDEKDQPVKGVSVTVDDQTVSTDDKGNAAFTLAVGEHTYKIGNLPQGYTIDQSESTFAVDPDQDMTFPLNLSRVGGDSSESVPPVKVANGRLTVQVLDENDHGVQGVQVTVGDKAVLTDAQGNASFEMPAGEYKFAITQLPQGYDLPSMEDTIAIKENGNMTWPVNLIKKGGFLPNTGESTGLGITLGALVLAGGGFFLMKGRRNHSK